MAKGCSWARQQRGVPEYKPSAVVYLPYTTNPEVPYCFYKLVTNIIRAVKIHVLSYPWYTVWYTTAVSQSAFRAQTTQFIIKYITHHARTRWRQNKFSSNIIAFKHKLHSIQYRVWTMNLKSAVQPSSSSVQLSEVPSCPRGSKHSVY